MRVSKAGDLITFINVFETKPQQQQALFDALSRFAEGIEDDTPGLIGVALHKSTDGLRVVNYAQWRSEEDYERFVRKHREQMEATLPFAERIDPHHYEVAYLREPTAS